MNQDSKIDHGYHLGGQILVVIFDLLGVCSSQFCMLIIADCRELSGSYHALHM